MNLTTRRTIGGSFLVMGNTIGAGMLSLPLITAASGVLTAIVLMVLSWSVMVITSFKLLKLCSQHPLGVNFTTLNSKQMPKLLQPVFIVMYLLLLYSLMSAYTTQGASLIKMASENTVTSNSLDALIYILIFGLIILNTKVSDYLNRSFVTLKLVFFSLCVILMIGYFNLNYALSLPISLVALLYAWPTLLPSFGFQNMVPVLYEYQQGDLKAIKKSIISGSLVVLAIYIVWVIICLGLIPQRGAISYETIYLEGNTLDNFIQIIKSGTESTSIHSFLTIFINIAIITSFICVGLSLYHYIRDIFKQLNINFKSAFGFILSFLPPFIFAVYYPKGFILALQYAAIFAVIVFVFTPIYLDKKERFKLNSIYPLLLGVLVIVAQVANLMGVFRLF
ncbi:amino acid transporter [Thiotrichales bacterium 19S9-12]|nr:amino acid transporter [Thiotrichales bacterium 19S9-11]MCF6811767.1 amino acid transporter [Thiotrichales bacterium 19S9-12]